MGRPGSRPVAQLVEHRSLKPGVAGSNPAWPATRLSFLLLIGEGFFNE